MHTADVHCHNNDHFQKDYWLQGAKVIILAIQMLEHA